MDIGSDSVRYNYALRFSVNFCVIERRFKAPGYLVAHRKQNTGGKNGVMHVRNINCIRNMLYIIQIDTRKHGCFVHHVSFRSSFDELKRRLAHQTMPTVLC